MTEAHVGFAWTGFNADHASILLPTVLALYRGTGDEHWKDAYETFLKEHDGLRWKRLHPGPHVRINGHPIYANQNAFRIHAMYVMETDAERRAVLKGLLEQIATMQWRRDFPGPFYRRFHTEDQWTRLRTESGWQDDQLHGCDEAWKLYRPTMLDRGGLPVLAHVRFPLGGIHMVLLSEQTEMIRRHLPMIWEMLTRVDLRKVDAGETNYLMTVVALHTYAFYFRNHDLFAAKENSIVPSVAPSDDQRLYGKELPLIRTMATGPAIDVAVEGRHAFAIGGGRLVVFDISNPSRPRETGRLGGLGNVRQILVDGGVAYVTSREDGLWIVDVSDPDRPRVLSHYDTVEFATGIAKTGDVLLVACRHYGVEVVDVSRPGEPVHLSTVRTGEAQSVVARGRWVYAGIWATAEVVAIDLDDPDRGDVNLEQPRITARVPLDGYGDGVDVEGKYLYAATGHHARSGPHAKPGDAGFGRGHGMEIFDISDPAHPRFVSRVKFPRWYSIGHDMWSVSVSGRYAFVADTHNGVFVVDVGDPTAPRVIAHRRLPKVGTKSQPDFVGGLAVAKGVIFAAGGRTGLHVLGARGLAQAAPPRKSTEAPRPDPRRFLAHPSPESREPVEVGGIGCLTFNGQVHAVDVAGEFAVVACGSEGVHVCRLGPEWERVSKWSGKGFATDVAVRGHDVFVASGADGLVVLALSDEGRLVERARYSAGGKSVRQVEVPPPGTHALIQVGSTRLEILDIRDLERIESVVQDVRPGLLYGDQLMRGSLGGRYAGIFWHVSGLHFYDLLARAGPRFSGDRIELRIGAANGLVAVGDRVLATRRGGYSLFDRDERRAAARIPIYRVGDRSEDLGKPVIFGDRLYASNRATGRVTVIDISDIERPRLVEAFSTDGNPGRVVRHGQSVLVPCGHSGLLIVNRPGW